MNEKTYTLEEIKKAFFEEFQDAGEVYFGDDIEREWKYFMERLEKQK